jgi:hypothetical protein
MREDGTKVPPTFKDEVASGIGGSEHVKHQEFGQLTPSDQSDGIGSTSVPSKPRSTKRRARKINRDSARLDEGARHPKWKRPNAFKTKRCFLTALFYLIASAHQPTTRDVQAREPLFVDSNLTWNCTIIFLHVKVVDWKNEVQKPFGNPLLTN